MPSPDVSVTPASVLQAGDRGPTVILVHGVGGDASAVWPQVIEALAEDHRVLAPNLLGTGATPADGKPFTVSDLAAQVVGAADAARAREFALVGYSLGGAVAAAVAAVHPERATSLTVIAGWAETDARGRAMFDLWARSFAADPELFVRLAVVSGFGPGFFSAVDDATIAGVVTAFSGIIVPGTGRQAVAAGEVNITSLLAAVTAPTRVVGLQHDQHVPPALVRSLADAVPHSQYTELSTGHLLPWEQPELFVETVVQAVRATQSAR